MCGDVLEMDGICSDCVDMRLLVEFLVLILWFSFGIFAVFVMFDEFVGLCMGASLYISRDELRMNDHNRTHEDRIKANLRVIYRVPAQFADWGMGHRSFCV